MKPQSFGLFSYGLPVFRGKRRFLRAVTDTEPSTQVEISYIYTHLIQTGDESLQFLDGVHEGSDLYKLAPDVAINAEDFQVFHLLRPLVLGKGTFDIDAKFRFP